MALPILTTTDDVQSIVSFLRNKPTGATLAETRAALGGAAVDGRKLSAYQLWQILTKENDRLKLTARGWELGRKSKPDQTVFREVLDGIPAYRSALEWAFHQKLDSVTNVDVAAHWHEHHPEATGTDNENTIKDQAVCFFRLCEGAGLGEMVVGRRGQPTRLNFNKSELTAYVEAGPSEPPWVEPPVVTEEAMSESAKTPPPSATDVTVEPAAKRSQRETSCELLFLMARTQQLSNRSKRCLGLRTFRAKSPSRKKLLQSPSLKKFSQL